MESVPENPVLKVTPGIIYEIRKIHNLEKPGRMEEAINILETWLLKQDHILKKDFSKEYLERTIISCKGSLEKSKKQIDRLCTMKTLLPKFFSTTNIVELKDILKVGKLAPMPNLTDDFYRIVMVNVSDEPLTDTSLMEYFKCITVLAEYLKANDYANGFIIIYDCRRMNFLDFVTKIDTVELQQFVSILVEGYGARLKSINIMTESKAVELLITIVKQFISEKIANRIYVQQSVEDLYKIIPKELLPADYGGKQKPLDSLYADVFQEVTSQKYIDYFKIMFKACTDETKRNAEKFNEEYMGMPGSFRCLSVD